MKSTAELAGFITHHSAFITMTANSFEQLYVGTLLFALANGTVEAVINPVTATLYPNSKTHHLNILHAGWPGGLVLGGLLFMLLGDLNWKWQIGLYLIPTAIIPGKASAKQASGTHERSGVVAGGGAAASAGAG